MAYTDYSISNNTYGYETEEERRRREAAGQTGPVNPETIADYSLASTPPNQVDQSTMGLQIPQSQQMQNIQMGQPAVQEQTTVVGQQPVVGGQPTVETVTPPVQQYLDMYQTAQTDPSALLKMSQDQNAPEWMRGRAREQAANLLNNERGFQIAQEQMKTMSPEDLESNLRKKTTEGSWLKAIMYGALGMEQSAQAEAAKLGIGKESAVLGSDGTPYMIKTAMNGTPIEGYNAKTGKKLSAEELVSATAGIAGTKLNIVGGSYINDKTGDVGRMVTDEKTGRSYIQTDKGRQSMEGFRPQSSTGSLDMQRVQQVQQQNIKLAGDWARLQMQVQGAAPEAANRFLGEFNAKHNTNYSLSSISGSAPQISLETGQMTGAQPQPQAMPQTQPAQQVVQPQPQVVNRQPPVAQTQPRVAAPVNPAQIQTQPAPIVNRGTNVGVSVGGTSPADIEIRKGLGKTQAETNISVAGKRSESFNKILDEEVRPNAQAGDTVSSTRKQQFQIFDRPDVDMNKIFGLATGAGRSPGDQSWTMIRDVLLGKFEGRTDDIKQRAAALGLSPAEQSALAEYQIANVAVNSANLKKTAGPGAVSDAEQKVNREAGVDPTKVPALGAYNAMAQSQFDADKQRYKGDWAESNPAQNALQLDKAWRVESQKLTGIYSEIAKERAKFIASNGSTTAAVKEGYKRFPIPEYDPSSGQWKKTKPLTSYNR
tara:strand:+ start:462 stop:2588 length:2127 start_codon:yes stop_codon:yes gene_type:complete